MIVPRYTAPKKRDVIPTPLTRQKEFNQNKRCYQVVSLTADDKNKIRIMAYVQPIQGRKQKKGSRMLHRLGERVRRRQRVLQLLLLLLRARHCSRLRISPKPQKTIREPESEPTKARSRVLLPPRSEVLLRLGEIRCELGRFRLGFRS